RARAAAPPAYVYGARAIRSAYGAIDTAFADYPHAIHYALKANSTLGLLRLLRPLGSRVDANSCGEIQVAHAHAGSTPTRGERCRSRSAPGSTRKTSCSPESGRHATSSRRPLPPRSE